MGTTLTSMNVMFMMQPPPGSKISDITYDWNSLNQVHETKIYIHRLKGETPCKNPIDWYLNV